MKVLLNWVLFAAVITGLYFGWKYISFSDMSGPYVLLFAVSLAFTWVEVLHWGSIKPFNCTKCMSGWFALILAIMFHTPFWYFYLFAGLLTGALFAGIKSRL